MKLKKLQCVFASHSDTGLIVSRAGSEEIASEMIYSGKHTDEQRRDRLKKLTETGDLDIKEWKFRKAHNRIFVNL